MCGIAGLSYRDGLDFDPAATARLLLAGLAERGQDATGYAFHGADGIVGTVKDSVPLAQFMPQLDLPASARAAIMHVRDFTKGRPGLNDNNHPIRYGGTVGVHNGHIDNDDELFDLHGRERSTPDISVDSEAIMMLVDSLGDTGAALAQVRGSAAVAILRDGQPERLTLAKRASRTLWLARGKGILLFASTREPLDLARKATGLRMALEEVRDGSVVEVRDGEVVARSRFAFDRRYVGRTNVSYPDIPEKRALVRLALAGF